MSSEDEAVAWLRAQAEGDKRMAEGLASYGSGAWSAVKNDDLDYTIRDDGAPTLALADSWREDAAHWIALHDPRDEIADCEAKLALIDELVDLRIVGIAYPDETGPEGAKVMLGILASAYRHREGYAEHWAASATTP
jgi:hypothetical protein